MTSLGRFLAFGFYLVILLAFSILAQGTLLPTSNLAGAWYYAALGYFLVSFLSAPFFMKPTDSIATAVTAGVLLLSIGIPSGLAGESAFKIGKIIGISYCGLVIIIALIALLIKPREPLQEESFLSKLFFILSDRLGRGEIIFSFVFLLSILSSFTKRPIFLLVLLTLWLFTLWLKPHEILSSIIKLRLNYGSGVNEQQVGIVRAFENPGIAIILLAPKKTVDIGTPILIIDNHSQLHIGRSVAKYELQDERWVRVLLGQQTVENRSDEGVEIIPRTQMAPNSAFALSRTQLDRIHVDHDTQTLLTSSDGQLVGFVAEESMTDHIQIELVSLTSDVYEGRLITVSIRGERVFYQVIDAVTKSEALEKKSSLGFFRVRARKVGKWDESENRFRTVKWLPQIYAPVYLWIDEPTGFQLDAVGHIPGSRFSVKLDINNAVTHNTAILGVLGCGKTCLTLELIARLVRERIKVICIDITGQYPRELSSLYDSAIDNRDDLAIDQDIEPLANQVSRNKEEGGNWKRFRELLNENINQFIGDGNRRIRIFNPEAYTVWKQTGGLYSGEASRAPLTPVEITRIISEGVLQAVSSTFSSTARLCIVFEEAHSLIPEWNSISFEGDQQATMGTAKAILQGRKYGLGCIVVTQRTANVIKSVLNQCNTIFAMRTFDATGMDFLSNYIGKDYAQILSVLEERSAVAYGKAISSDSPLIIKVNERSQFLETFIPAMERELANDGDDDVPF